MQRSHRLTRAVQLYIAPLILGLGCGTESSEAPLPEPTPNRFIVDQVGPRSGGFVSDVAFDESGRPWLSGDDGSGLYRREGAGWSLMEGAPLNWSTYALTFDPNVSQRIYAPNHFGRGMAVTDDAGATWREIPFADAWGESWYDLLALDVGGSTRLIAAGSFGLWRSDDGGQNFAPIDAPQIPAGTIQALHHDEDRGVTYAGSDQGGLFFSSNSGETWDVLIPPSADGIPVTDITSSANALYMGFALGLVARSRTFDLAGVEILDTSADFASALWTRVAVADGASADQDRLYVGTVGPNPVGFGLYASEDGGDTFAPLPGMTNRSVFRLAIDPTDSNHLVMTSVNGPVLESVDAGATWTDISDGVSGWAILAVAQDPADPTHLLFSSLAGLPGNGVLFESRDDGQQWSVVDCPADVYAIEVVGDDLVVGDYHRGIFRRTDGAWTRVLDIDAGVRRIVRDPSQPQRLLAVTSEVSTADLGLYVSTDEGRTWALLVSTPIFDVQLLTDGTALVASQDLLFIRDAMAVEAGLASELNGSFVTGIDADPNAPDRLLAAADDGRVFSAVGCTPDSAPCTWTEHPSPVRDAVAVVQVDDQGDWWLGGAAVDLSPTAESSTGLWHSTDGGTSWQPEALYPCDLVWRLQRGNRPGELLVGLWGGGLYRRGIADSSP